MFNGSCNWTYGGSSSCNVSTNSSSETYQDEECLIWLCVLPAVGSYTLYMQQDTLITANYKTYKCEWVGCSLCQAVD